MPIQIKCGGCGTILQEFQDLPLVSVILQGKHHANPADVVIKRNGGHCPKCGKKLETDVNKQQVSISPFNPYVLDMVKGRT